MTHVAGLRRKRSQAQYLVLAGNSRQPSRWARENGLGMRDWVLVSDAQSLRGIEGPKRRRDQQKGPHWGLVKVGSYRDRPDIAEVLEMLAARGF